MTTDKEDIRYYIIGVNGRERLEANSDEEAIDEYDAHYFHSYVHPTRLVKEVRTVIKRREELPQCSHSSQSLPPFL